MNSASSMSPTTAETPSRCDKDVDEGAQKLTKEDLEDVCRPRLRHGVGPEPVKPIACLARGEADSRVGRPPRRSLRLSISGRACCSVDQ